MYSMRVGMVWARGAHEHNYACGGSREISLMKELHERDVEYNAMPSDALMHDKSLASNCTGGDGS